MIKLKYHNYSKISNNIYTLTSHKSPNATVTKKVSKSKVISRFYIGFAADQQCHQIGI